MYVYPSHARLGHGRGHALLYTGTRVRMALMGAAGAGRSCALRCSREFWTTWHMVWSSSIERLLFASSSTRSFSSGCVLHKNTMDCSMCLRKVCPQCNTMMHVRRSVCECGHVFQSKRKTSDNEPGKAKKRKKEP